jgi:hypothetical protein
MQTVIVPEDDIPDKKSAMSQLIVAISPSALKTRSL